MPVPKRRQELGIGQEHGPESQLTSQRKDQRPAQGMTQSSSQFSGGERTSAPSPIPIPTDVTVFGRVPVFTHGLRPTPVPALPSSRSVPIPLQIPPLIFVDPQEAERYRAIWEFVVIFRLVRGSEVCLPRQDRIPDFISNDAGVSGGSGSGNYRSSKPGYPLPPGFNRHYLDYLVDGYSNPDPDLDPEHIPQQSPCPPPPAPARPPTPALSPQMANFTLNSDDPPKKPPRLKKIRFQEPPSSSTHFKSGSMPSHSNLNHQRPTANLPTAIATSTTATPSPSPAPGTGNIPPNWTEAGITKTITAITPTMSLHYCSFRSIVRVIEAHAKIWITTRPDHFRETLHARWMLGLPEEFALKLWFACQGRYTILDLATGREFPTVRTADGRYEHGTAYTYMAMIRRYLVAVADAGASFLSHLAGKTTACTCPAVGWYQRGLANAGVSTGGPTLGPSNNTDTIPASTIEGLLNQQANRFLTSDPAGAGAGSYIDPRITTLLANTIPPQGLAKLAQLDWISLAFSYPTLQLNLLVLSYTGRLALHSVLRTLYQDLQTLYNDVEPLPLIVSPADTYRNTNTNRNRNTSIIKPFTFEKCALYLEMQLSARKWGVGAVSKDLGGSILGNQPWDGPSRRKGDDWETSFLLRGLAEEVREALGFLASGALHWARVKVRVDV